MKKKRKFARILIGLIVLIIIGLIIFYSFNYIKSLNSKPTTSTGSGSSGGSGGGSGGGGSVQPVIITKESLPSYIKRENFVKELPDNAALELALYNFDSGQREWEESFIIKKSSAYLKNENEEVDAVIIVHSKYVGELGKGFCNTIKKAKENGDFGVELKQSEAAFMWKYRSMMEYKDCFGI